MTAPAPEDLLQVGHDFVAYRRRLVLEGDAAAEAHDYDRAVELYLLATFYDLMGEHRPIFDDLGQKIGYAFDQRFAFAQPSVLRRVATCANALGMDLLVIQLRFVDLASIETKAIAHLRPPLSPEQAWTKIEERLRMWLAIDAGLRGSSRRNESEHTP
jgi:hypothetical protein